MRILQVTHRYHPEIGGVERHVAAISEQLAELGHEVVVVTMAPPGEVPRAERRRGVEIVRLRSFGVGPYRGPIGLRAYLGRNGRGFDVVHAHNYHAAMLSIAASVPHPCFVVTPHLNDRPHDAFASLLHRPYSVVGRWAVSRARAVICSSPMEQDRVISQLRVPRERTVVIPQGADSLNRSIASEAVARDSHLLLSIGRLEAYKHVEAVINAISALPADYRLVVVGDGPVRQALQQQAQELGVSARVTFCGRVTDEELSRWYQRAGTMITLSAAEAYGLTVVEALSAGCRVVCSDIPAFRDQAERFPGWIAIVPNRAPATVAAAILATSTSPRPELEPTGLSWRDTTDKLAELYRSMVQQTGSVRLATVPKSPASVHQR